MTDDKIRMFREGERICVDFRGFFRMLGFRFRRFWGREGSSVYVGKGYKRRKVKYRLWNIFFFL